MASSDATILPAPAQVEELRLRDDALPRHGLVDRAARRPRLFGTRGDELAGFEQLTVLVAGTGSVGQVAALHLARMGVGGLLLADPGSSKPESLLTHPLLPEDVGVLKVEALGRRVLQISPRTRVQIFRGPAQELDPGVLATLDAVLLATDNLSPEIELGQRCLNLGLPLFQGSVHGETLVAQVRSLPNAEAEGPCLGCPNGAAEWQQLARETVYSCEDGVHVRGQPAQGPPTTSISPLCSLAGDLLVLELLRSRLAIGRRAGPRLVELRGFPLETVTTPLARNPACPCHHRRWTRASLVGTPADVTPAALLAAAGLSAGALTVGGHVFVERAGCACPEPHAVGRFVPAGSRLGACPRCGQPLRTGSASVHREGPRRLLAPLATRPLGELGVTAAAASVLVRRGEDAWLFTARNAQPPASAAPPVPRSPVTGAAEP